MDLLMSIFDIDILNSIFVPIKLISPQPKAKVRAELRGRNPGYTPSSL